MEALHLSTTLPPHTCTLSSTLSHALQTPTHVSTAHGLYRVHSLHGHSEKIIWTDNVYLDHTTILVHAGAIPAVAYAGIKKEVGDVVDTTDLNGGWCEPYYRGIVNEDTTFHPLPFPKQAQTTTEPQIINGEIAINHIIQQSNILYDEYIAISQYLYRELKCQPQQKVLVRNKKRKLQKNVLCIPRINLSRYSLAHIANRVSDMVVHEILSNTLC